MIGAAVVLGLFFLAAHASLVRRLIRNAVETDRADVALCAQCEHELDPLLPPRCAVAYDGPTFPDYAGTLCEREPGHIGRHIGDTISDPVATIAWYTAAEKAAQKASAPAGLDPA